MRRHSAFGRTLVPVALLVIVSSSSFAQNTSGANETDRKRRSSSTDDNGGRRTFNPEDMQARLLSSLRERLEVTDDEEWKLISDRITKVNELRRNAPGGFGAIAAFASRGSPGSQSSGDTSRSSRSSSSSNNEVAALQSALRDKLPDAEIKARLDRVREARKDNEAKLSKAQEDLRALLTVRQEAVAVMFGLLP